MDRTTAIDRTKHTRGVDVIAHNLGSIIRIDAATTRARRWMLRHLRADERIQATRGAYTLAEHRQGIDIVSAAIAGGLNIQDAATGRIAKGEGRP